MNKVISEKLPTEEDKQQTKQIIEYLKSQPGIFPSEHERQLRKKALGTLHRYVGEWLSTFSIDSSRSISIPFHIATFGSYYLGVYHSTSDIDALLIVPRDTVKKFHFFNGLYQKLHDISVTRQQSGNSPITELISVSDAFVPVLKFHLFGIPIDLLFCALPNHYFESHGNSSGSRSGISSMNKTVNKRSATTNSSGSGIVTTKTTIPPSIVRRDEQEREHIIVDDDDDEDEDVVGEKDVVIDERHNSSSTNKGNDDDDGDDDNNDNNSEHDEYDEEQEEFFMDRIMNDDTILIHLDSESQRAISGPRVARQLIRLVPNLDHFRLTLRCVKLIAKRRGFYSSVMGYLGGVALAVMVGMVCQCYPNALPNVLLNRFFKMYANWNWGYRAPVSMSSSHQMSNNSSDVSNSTTTTTTFLTSSASCPNLSSGATTRSGSVAGAFSGGSGPSHGNVNTVFGFSVWNPQSNMRDRNVLMPILTPAYPPTNCTFNMTRSTFDVIKMELTRGDIVSTDALLGRCSITHHNQHHQTPGNSSGDMSYHHPHHSQLQQQQRQESIQLWPALFEETDFFVRYPNYLEVEVSADNETDHRIWSAFFESRFRYLILKLEQTAPNLIIHLLPEQFRRQFPYSHGVDGDAGGAGSNGDDDDITDIIDLDDDDDDTVLRSSSSSRTKTTTTTTTTPTTTTATTTATKYSSFYYIGLNHVRREQHHHSMRRSGSTSSFEVDLTAPAQEFEEQISEWVGKLETMHRPVIRPIKR